VSLPTRRNKDVLHNVSFEVKSGVWFALWVALFRENPTIAGLAATFLNPLSGPITVDDQDYLSRSQ